MKVVRELIRQLDEVGSKSLPLVAMAGSAIGVILSLEASLQSQSIRRQINVSRHSGVLRDSGHGAGDYRLGRERARGRGDGRGAGIDEGDRADRCHRGLLQSTPYWLLAATRILACILMLPLLTIATDACALLTGWFAQAMVEPLSFHQFIANGFKGATFSAFLPQTFKTAIYGLIIGLIACFQGMRTRGGAAGVGRAATNSVVLASLFLIIADVVMVKFILVFFR